MCASRSSLVGYAEHPPPSRSSDEQPVGRSVSATSLVVTGTKGGWFSAGLDLASPTLLVVCTRLLVHVSGVIRSPGRANYCCGSSPITKS